MMSLVTGCISVCSRHMNAGGCIRFPRYYPGLYTDAFLISLPFRTEERTSFGEKIAWPILGLVDLPFSTICDTILLPLDIWAYNDKQSKKED